MFQSGRYITGYVFELGVAILLIYGAGKFVSTVYQQVRLWLQAVELRSPVGRADGASQFSTGRTSAVAVSNGRGSEMLAELEAFYRRERIWPTDFDCRHCRACSAGEPRFTSAKCSFVGPAYEQGELPRILFLSLDSGDGSPNPDDRTLSAVRATELSRNIAAIPKTQHWYLTHRLAADILNGIGHRSIRPEAATTYFAHVNTVKCSVNNPGRREAPARLAANCRGYLPGELAVLRPDIVVTQGAKAREAIQSQFRLRGRQDISADGASGACGYIDGLAEGGTLWVATHHPSAYGVFWRQHSQIWPIYLQKAAEFASARRARA